MGQEMKEKKNSTEESCQCGEGYQEHSCGCSGGTEESTCGHGFDSHHLHQKLRLRGKTLNLLHCKKSPVFKAQRLFC